MTDAELSAAALVELKLTTRGLKGYTPTAGSHWANVLDFLGQVTIDTKSRDMAVSELRMTTVGYDYYVKKGATPGTGSHWGKALAYIAEIGVILKVTVTAPSGSLSGTVTVGASITPANQAATVTRVEFYVDSVLKATDTTSPYSFSWDTSTGAAGSHQLKARAFYPVNKVVEGLLTVSVTGPLPPPPPPPVPQPPPVNSAAPAISGTATEGQTLSVSNGTWSNSPTSYSYQWVRCNGSGTSCVSSPGATNNTYVLATADVGATIRCAVTAYNSAGPSAIVQSAQTAVVGALVAAVPTNTVAPVITGTPTQGQTLTISDGTWTNSPTSYTHCWDQCDSAGANCVDIVGQNCGAYNNTYVLTAADVGKKIKCYTSAFNATQQSAPVLSAATAVIVASSMPPPQPPPTGTALRYFTDFKNYGGWPETLINRWDTGTPATAPWSSPGDTGTPYLNGGGLYEVQTPYGPGFRFVTTDQMTVNSGGKMGFIADIQHFVRGVGYTDEFSGKVMLPRAGNPDGFSPNGDWNCLMEFHSNNQKVYNEFGVDALVNKLYFRTYGPGYPNDIRKIWAPNQVQFDNWYDFRWRIKWSYGSDGLAECWLDGVQLAAWTGANLSAGEVPWLQFGYYSESDRARNEAWFAAMYKA